MKLMPASRHLSIMRMDVASSTWEPKVMVPKQARETVRSVCWRVRVCMVWNVECNAGRGGAKNTGGPLWVQGADRRQRQSHRLKKPLADAVSHLGQPVGPF